MSCLLYCVTRPGPALAVAAGVCDCAVHSAEWYGLRLYWSLIADPDACLGTAEALKKAALQFHMVLREILSQATPIPFRFPMLLEGEDAITQHLSVDQHLYREALERIGDTVQYEIVGTWPADKQADLATPVSGKEYLRRRQAAAVRLSAIDAKLKLVTAGSVREWRARQERRTHRWFALVGREQREQFLASLRTAGPSEGVRLRLSGPWPPSEFVTPRGERG
jgi:hypothetical protein